MYRSPESLGLDPSTRKEGTPFIMPTLYIGYDWVGHVDKGNPDAGQKVVAEQRDIIPPGDMFTVPIKWTVKS